LQAFKKTPFLELVVCSVIIGLHGLLASRPKLVSDALFLEGITLSVVGAIIACRVPGSIRPPSSPRRSDENASHPRSRAGRSLLGSFLKRRNGFRILFVGLVLIGAAVVIGELFVRLGT